MINKAVLKEKIQLTHDVIELTFETENEIKYKAGQFITIKIDDGEKPCFRAYSIASPPSKNEFKLCIKVMETGRGSNWLNSLKPKNEIVYLGPSGHFTFTKSEKLVLFIATGTGIAPFTSMVEDELTNGSKQKLHILFGVRHIKDVFYAELLENLSKQYANFTYEITLSRPESENWNGSIGRVTTVLENMEIDTNNTDIYICGLYNMIESVQKTLIEKGVKEEDIHFEKYD